MITDVLSARIKELNNPSVIGIDTDFDYLPEELKATAFDLESAAAAILVFNKKIIDNIFDIVPAVKVQVAYYEKYGVEGMHVFKETLDYAKSKGLITIADIKRNDIGATAAAYSAAYLGGVEINGVRHTGFDSDFITINGYLGEDGLIPFVKDAKKTGKGVFILVKTSNPGSGQFQDKVFEDGDTLYEKMGALVSSLGSDNIGASGYNLVGAVVGATHPAQAAVLRKKMPNTFFLVPGYGAQGGKATDLKACFDEAGGGAIVNSSRGIICAYKAEKYKGQDYWTAARNACIDMQKDLDLF